MIKVAISIGCLKTGGAEVFVVNLLKSLDYRKYEVLLFVLSSRYNTFLEKEVDKLPIEIVYMNKKEGFKPLVMLRIYKKLKMFKPDVIHGNIGGIIYFLLYILLTNVKAIHTTHTLANLEFGRVKRAILKIFYQKKKIIPIAISKAVKESIINTYKIKEDIIKLIPNGIDVKKFSLQRQYQLNPIVIGHVGRFEFVKNHKTIIKVYKKLLEEYDNLKLKLIGDGTLYKEVEQEVSNLKTVEMIRSTNNVAKELNSIDIFFFPSSYEGMPLSLIEALASGAIIIGSSVGGIREVIEEDVNGYLLNDCYDVEGFVNVFKKVINNKDKLIEISKNNIEKAKQYDLANMVNSYQKLYDVEAINANR